MAAMCACGRYIYSTSTNPWSIYTLDGQGRVIEGTCIHGVHFLLTCILLPCPVFGEYYNG